MGFEEAVKHVFIHYADFSGRAGRGEYWYYTLFHILASAALRVLAVLPWMGVLLPLFLLGTVVPGLAVCWRRLHDTGRSGLWTLLALIPLVGTIVLLVWLAGEGQPEANAYGAPLGSGGYPVFACPPPGSGRAILEVRCLAGPMQGQTFHVGPQGLRFGREPDCGIRFPDGTPGISSRHCCLRWERDIPVLVDLGSRYGTFLDNGRQLPPNYPERVVSGTRFYLGSSNNLFQIEIFGA
ncbi:MAG: DUF805 domain-containing protein [Oscillospiraceae bacterium]